MTPVIETDRLLLREARGFVEFELNQIENAKWNRWIIVLKETEKLIGTCLVFYNDEDNESRDEICRDRAWHERVYYYIRESK